MLLWSRDRKIVFGMEEDEQLKRLAEKYKTQTAIKALGGMYFVFSQ